MLTDAQKATLKAAILADPVASAAAAGLDYQAVADWLNATGSFVVWRTTVPVEEYREAVTWTEVDALAAGKARIWEWLTGNMTLPIASAKLNVRQGLSDCWAANSTTRAALLAVAKRSATKAEQLLATGTGSSASPATMSFEGQISVFEIGGILA